MASFSTLFIYWCLILSLVSVLAFIGNSLTYLISSYSRGREKRILGDVAVIGLCYLIVVSLLIANIFGSISRTVLLGFVVLPLLIALVKFIIRQMQTTETFEVTRKLKQAKNTLTPLAVYSAAALVPFYTFLDVFVSRNFILTSATKFNADLGMYLQMSSNLITHGFNDNGKVIGANVGALARFDHPGAQAALAGKSQLMGLLPHQMGIIATSGLLAILALCVHQVLKDNQKVNDWRLYLVGIWVIVNPLVTEMSNQFFYAQLLTAVMVLGLLSLCQRFVLHRENGYFSFIFLVGISAFVTSPEVAVMLVTIFFLPVIYAYFSVGSIPFRIGRNNQTLKSLAISLAAIGTVYPFVLEEIQVLIRTTQLGIAGWSSSVLSPIGWLGLMPGTYFSRSTTLELAIGFIAFTVVAGLSLRLLFSHRQDSNSKLLISILVVALFVLLAMTVFYGPTEYQTWKTAISLTPFLIIGLFTVLNTWDKSKKNVYLFVCVALGAGLAGSSLNWSGITQTNYVNQDLIAITQSVEYQNIGRIDVDLAPKVETMLVIPLLKGEVNLVSPSYFSFEGSPRKFECLLTWRGKAEQLGWMSELVVQRGEYVIVGKNNCEGPYIP